MRDTEPMTKDGHQQQMQTLADLRRAAGLSQTDVAKRMGVNQPRVSQIEKDFPNLHYRVVASYLRALDQAAYITVKDTRITLNLIQPDHRSPGAQANRASRSADGIDQMTSATAEELPLEQRQPRPGGDDPGRDVDQADPEGHERDREDSQQT